MPEDDEITDDRIYNILIVDDERETLKALCSTIERADQFKSQIVTVESGEEALEEMAKQEFDLVLSDNKLPGLSGIELLTSVKETSPDTIRMLITGFADLDIAREALYKAEVNNFIEKPWNIDELRMMVHAALKRKYERETTRRSKNDSVSEAISQIQELIQELPHMGLGTTLSERPKLRFEFDNWRDFNRFSFEIKRIGNVSIYDVYTFEKRYIIVVCVNMPTHMRK
jgi:YesN/AraC family two-component response regulator